MAKTRWFPASARPSCSPRPFRRSFHSHTRHGYCFSGNIERSDALAALRDRACRDIAAILDPNHEPVWFRNLPPNLPTPVNQPVQHFEHVEQVRTLAPPFEHVRLAHQNQHVRSFAGIWSPALAPAMAMTTTGISHTHESPSPTSDARSATPPTPPPISRPRPGRFPARLPLRASFRTFTGFATVLVGDDKNPQRPLVQYLIHKELLTAASPFFAAALNGKFAEGMDQTVRLPEEKPEIFDWFLQWLYTGSLTTPAPAYQFQTPAYGVPTQGMGNPPPLPPGMTHSSTLLPWSSLVLADTQHDGDLRNHAGSPKYFLLIDLYGLSDRLLTTPLSNAVLTTVARLSESTNSVPTPSDTRILYDSIREGPLRRLVLDLFAYKKTDKLLATHRDEWHARFLRDLVVKLKRPGPEGVERHSLVAWRPGSYATSKACEGCREVLKPGSSHDKCVSCDRAFCSGCVRKGQGERVVLGEDTGGCKPWTGRGLCVRYHEHGDGEGCS